MEPKQSTRAPFAARSSAGFAAFMTLAISAGAAQEPAMFRADAAHRGVYAGHAPSLTSVRWRFHLKAKIIASPVVSNGVVYIGGDDHRVYAVRASNGALLWKFATNGPVNSSPAVANGSVFVGSLDGYVYALDALSGRQKWRFKTGGERRFTAPGIHGLIPRAEVMADPFDLLLSSPAVANGLVYIGSGDHNVYALDAQTGALRWKVLTGNVVHASPAVVAGTVYVGSWDRYLYALNARTGAVRWKFQTGDDRTIYNQVGIAGSAAVAGGMVYFGCRDGHFYAVDAATGKLRWKHDEHGSWGISSPALANGTVYFTTSDELRFFGLDATNGRVSFSTPYDAFAFSSPSIAGNAVYYGTFGGSLFRADARSGRVLARFATDGARRNRSKYVNAKGKLDLNAAFPDQTLEGTILGLNHIYSLGSIVGSPAISGGVLFVGAADGTLYAIN